MRTNVRRYDSVGRVNVSRKRRSRSRTRTGLGRSLLLLLLLRLLNSSSLAGEQWPVSADELASLWEGQRTEISTAVVRFRCFNSSLENPDNTPERVAELLDEYDLVQHPEALDPFLLALAGRPFSVANPAPDTTLIVAGRRRRVTGFFSDYVTDGELEADYQPSNHQVSLYPPGKFHVHFWDLRDLRWTPSAGVSAAGWTLTDVRDDVVVFDVPPLEGGTEFQVTSEIDVATGIVRHKMTRYRGGNPATERYQSGLEVHSSGIVFPKLGIKCTYENGVVRKARIVLVESASFNEPVDSSAFALAIPEGTTIVDYRPAEKSAYRATTAAADALALPLRNLDSPPRTAPPVSTGPSPQIRWSILVGFHLVVLLILGAIAIYRRRSVPTQQT